MQRPLKFIKYLRDFGWNPIVLCPEPGIYPHFDESLQKELEVISPEIIRVSPKTFFHFGGGSSSPQKEKKVPDALAKIIRRVLRLFMYPDNKRGWIDPAVEEGRELIREKDIEVIFSTAPPFSNHIIGKRLSRETGKPLVLDYRDAWLKNHFMDDMFGWQKQKMLRMEAGCIEAADVVTVLDDFVLNEMRNVYGALIDEINVIPHGFDADDFEKNDKPTLKYKEGKLNFLYSGLFYESNQPDIFFRALLKAEELGLFHRNDVHLHFQGGLDGRIKKLITQLNLNSVVSDYGYQEHQTAVSNLLQADVLWMISNFDKAHKQVKSGKLFEYFGTGKPVLGLVNEGEEAELLREYGAGFVGTVTSEEKISAQLGKIFNQWEDGVEMKGEPDFIKRFNRRDITGKLAQIFDKISSQ